MQTCHSPERAGAVQYFVHGATDAHMCTTLLSSLFESQVAIALCTLGGVLALALVAAWGLWLHHR